MVWILLTVLTVVLANSLAKACNADHSLCSAFSVDPKFYCRHEWCRGNCRHMCGRGCPDPDVDEDFRAGILGGESCLSDCGAFQDDAVCGTNGRTYKNICELFNSICRSRNKFTLRGRGSCVCQTKDRSSCKEYENYKGYYCKQPWVKRYCKYFCGYCIPKPRCSGKVDVGFIFEPTKGFTITYQKYFVKTLASVFGVTSQQSRAAVITLGKVPEFSINFGDHSQLTTFNEALDEILLPVGGEATHLDDALTIAHQHMFHPSNGMRPDASKLLVLLARNLPNKQLTSNKSRLLAHELRAQGVVVMIIGKGAEAYREEFSRLTGDADNVLISPTFTQLVSPGFINNITDTICTKVTTSARVQIDSNDIPVR